jgi:hypothetical protein
LISLDEANGGGRQKERMALTIKKIKGKKEEYKVQIGGKMAMGFSFIVFSRSCSKSPRSIK